MTLPKIQNLYNREKWLTARNTTIDENGNLLVGTTTSPSDSGAIVANSGIYLGGTGSANKLDDYEEGTYTVVISGLSGTATISNNSTLSYTKVGDTVHVRGFIQGIDANGVGNGVQVSLPFSIGQNNDTDRLTGSIFILNAVNPPRDYIIYPQGTTPFFRIQDARNSNFDQIDEGDLGSNNINIGLSVTFKTDS